KAYLRRAFSVGSPIASPFFWERTASLQSAIDKASCLVFPKVSTTVILFWVRVPVLSEQTIAVQPKVSTAVSLRIIELRLDILVTPIDKTIVTTATNPSGMAAT